jgi:cellulose biosynthesis protein BcsQ
MIVGIFNNKGGVGKTTYMYHVAHVLSRKGKSVLMVDCDPQCNLTAYALDDSAVERSWHPERGNSIFLAVQPLHESLGDVRDRKPINPSREYPTLWLVPGDPKLSEFEDTLGDAWNRAKGGNSADVRKQSGIFKFIKSAAAKVEAEFTFLDLGPSLGALNRVALASCDYFIVPVAPDLFSIRGTENLGNKLVKWHHEWKQIGTAATETDIELPHGAPKLLGYVMQQHNLRNNAAGMTIGWEIFGSQVEKAVLNNIVAKLVPLKQVIRWDDNSYDLGAIPNLHSLVPYSQAARKPIFDCDGGDGVRGAHLSKARESFDLFEPMANTLIGLI